MTTNHAHANLPSDRGTYILVLHLEAPTRLTVGKLGAFDFAAGWYAYVGSAFGSGGLRGRLKHHLTETAKPHWHIDYLRTATTVRDVWFLTSETRHEHIWSSRLQSLPGAAVPVPRFGASDCKCAAHLIYFPDEPDFTTIRAAVGVPLQQMSR